MLRTLLSALLLLPILGSSAHAGGALSYHACSGVQGVPRDARCATLSVFENRVARTGRRIDLGVVILPAQHKNAGAILPIGGGPGQSVIALIPYFTQAFKPLRTNHDLVFVDQRGTRHSNQLQCPLYTDPVAYFKELFPNRALQKCRETLAQRADLDQYGTSIAADDLDDVRAALGYEKITLVGGSYGTEAAQEYARRHPSHVRALLLESVATTDFLVPLPYAQGAQHALDQLFLACAGASGCRTAFPGLHAHFYAVLHRFDRGDVPVTLPSRKTQRSLMLSREVFVDRLRQLLYDPAVASIVPLIVEDAYRGDTRELAEALNLVTLSFATDLSWGMSMSVNCSEDDPFITRAAIAAANRGTFLRDARIAAQQRACVTWHVKAAHRSYLQPVRSDAPILMLSGTDDPATPPQFARRQLPYYPNGRQILIPHGGHDNESPCLDRIRVAFLDRADVKAVDASCITSFKRPPFVLTNAALRAFF